MLNCTLVAKNGSHSNDMGSNNNSYYPDTVIIINFALNAPLLLISIIGNAFVLAAILRTPLRFVHHPPFSCAVSLSQTFLLELLFNRSTLTINLLVTIIYFKHRTFCILYSVVFFSFQ